MGDKELVEEQNFQIEKKEMVVKHTRQLLQTVQSIPKSDKLEAVLVKQLASIDEFLETRLMAARDKAEIIEADL